MLLKLLHLLGEEDNERKRYYYFKERDDVKFLFYSTLELNEKDFPKAMGIIRDNVSKGIAGSATASQIAECFKKSGIVAVDISSEDKGKGWLIKLSDNPHAFID